MMMPTGSRRVDRVCRGEVATGGSGAAVEPLPETHSRVCSRGHQLNGTPRHTWPALFRIPKTIENKDSLGDR